MAKLTLQTLQANFAANYFPQETPNESGFFRAPAAKFIGGILCIASGLAKHPQAVTNLRRHRQMTTAEMTTIAPSEIAKRFGVDHAKVLRWIDSGELHAVNVASAATGRPRWRVTAEALADFESRRANVPPAPKPTRRRIAAIEKRYY